MLNNLTFLFDEGIVKSSIKLNALWEQSKTFVILPSKFKDAQNSILEALKALPLSLHKDHFILLTSGSTGAPRLVIGSKLRAQKLVNVLFEVQQCQILENIIGTLPLSYSFGLINQWLLAKEEKLQFVPSEGLASPKIFFEILSCAPNSMLCMIGAQVELLRQTVGAHQQFPLVKRIHFAGGLFPQLSLPYLNQIFPNAIIFNNYGCVEAMPRLAIRLSGESLDPHNIGKPLPGIELYSDLDQKLQFKSPYSAIAVIDQGRVHFIDQQDWTATGDLGLENPDGTWTLLGRENAVFKRYGEKVSLSEIESKLKQNWDSSMSFYREKDRHGEDGYVIVLSPHPSKDQVVNFLQSIRNALSKPLWPLALASLNEIPKLPSGKPDVLKLAQLVERDGQTHWRHRL